MHSGFDVLAMVMQFQSIVRWEELPYIIIELNNLGLTDKELKKLSYQEWCKNPGLVASHFQCKVEVFLKEMILDGPLGKAKYDTMCIKFQEKGSPQVHKNVFSMHQILKTNLP